MQYCYKSLSEVKCNSLLSLPGILVPIILCTENIQMQENHWCQFSIDQATRKMVQASMSVVRRGILCLSAATAAPRTYWSKLNFHTDLSELLRIKNFRSSDLKNSSSFFANDADQKMASKIDLIYYFMFDIRKISD